MTAPNVRIRLAQHNDLAVLMRYMRDFHYFDHTEPFDDGPAQAAMEKVVTHPKLGKVWLIEQDEEAVGYIVLTLAYRLEYRGYCAFLDELFIRADKRGQGIGTTALRFLCDACKELGVQKLQLEVKQDNPAASSLYKKIGFVLQKRDVLTLSFE